jgi:acetyl-CoA carboxylase biotin carboxyl carrier protein
MVGTYYSTPSPEAPAFVKIGDRVTADTVVCIIEAMKVFNEIKAEVAGIVESIEVNPGAPVEFGQVLMKVRTA